MNNRVARWAYGAQVINRINFVLTVTPRKEFDMVYVDETASNAAITIFKLQAADVALASMVFDALLPRPSIPFICIYDDLLLRTFDVIFPGIYLFGDLTAACTLAVLFVLVVPKIEPP